MLFQFTHHVSNRRILLTDRDIDALDAGAFLIDDRVNRHGGLTGLAVADDQLTLTPANRHHSVDGFQTGLHRLTDRLALDHARRDHLGGRGHGRGDRTLAINRLAQRIDHAA